VKFAAIILTLLTVPGICYIVQQKSNVATATVTGLQKESWVAVFVSVTAADKDVVIPTCGGEESEPETLCRLAVEIQVKDSKGWGAAQNKHHGQVLGHTAPSKWKAVTVGKYAAHTFVFSYPLEEFQIGPDQMIRLSVKAWTNADAMRDAQSKSIQVVTAPFRAP
jgi:hypothetical protein